MHAANLVSELKSVDDNSVIRAWGGERLISEGIEISKNIKDISLFLFSTGNFAFGFGK